MKIFEHTDVDGDTLQVNHYDDGDTMFRFPAKGQVKDSLVIFTPEHLVKLIEALRPFDPNPGVDEDALLAEYRKGRQSAIDDYSYVDREQMDAAVAQAQSHGYKLAKEELAALDPKRTAALEKAAAVAKGLRSTGFASAGEVSTQTILTYALYLLDQLPMEAKA